VPDINRRKFLIAGAGVGAAGLLTGVVATTLPEMLEAGRERPQPAGTGILVIVTLYGGNDGINTVIPYTNNAYHDARPDLAYAPDGSSEHRGTVAYWHVHDADSALADLLSRGATAHEDVRDFGGGYRGAVVIDPFGNALGIMQRPTIPTTGAPATNGAAA